MKTEEQVVSLELAKDLKGLGLTQDSWIHWVLYTDESITEQEWERLYESNFTESADLEFEWGLDCELCKRRVVYKDRCSAYTVAELGEMLPAFFSICYDSYDEMWVCESPWGFCDKCSDQEEKSVGTVLGTLTKCSKRCRFWKEAKKQVDVLAKMLICLIKEGIVKVEDIK